MLLLLSGEAASDMGAVHAGSDGSPVFEAGPLALVVDGIIEEILNFSPLSCDRARYVTRVQLSRVAKSMNSKPRLVIPGVKRPAGNAGDYLQAYALAVEALRMEVEEGDSVIAVLFKDSDGTRSDRRTRWNDLVAAMEAAFVTAGYSRGVAMVARPKQEAWFICAVKDNPYVNCAVLEDESGNDNSPNALKAQLAELLGAPVAKEVLVDLVRSGRFDAQRIEMPSFERFMQSIQSALAEVVPSACRLAGRGS